jgi:hypothetical protein
MDIYVVSEYYYPDNFKVNDMVREFVQRGHNVTTLAGLPDYETGTVRKEYRFFRRRKETVDGAKVVRVSTVSRRTGAFFRILTYSSFAFNGFIHTKLCRKPSCDVIFVNQITPILQAIPALSIALSSSSYISFIVTLKTPSPGATNSNVSPLLKSPLK